MSAFGGNQDTSELPITIYNQELVLTFFASNLHYIEYFNDALNCLKVKHNQPVSIAHMREKY